MTPKEGAGPILPEFMSTEPCSELLDVFWGEEGPSLRIGIDRGDQGILLNDRKGSSGTFTSGGVCPSKPVSDGCSRYPKAL